MISIEIREAFTGLRTYIPKEVREAINAWHISFTDFSVTARQPCFGGLAGAMEMRRNHER